MIKVCSKQFWPLLVGREREVALSWGGSHSDFLLVLMMISKLFQMKSAKEGWGVGVGGGGTSLLERLN